MQLDEIVAQFATLTSDSVAIGYRAKEGDWARFVWMNEAFSELYGWTLDELRNEPVSKILWPGGFEEFARHVTEQIEAGVDNVVAEAWGVRKDGRRIWTSVSVVFLPTDDRGGRYSFAVYRDLTKLKEREALAQKALRENKFMLEELKAVEGRLRAAINCVPGPLAIWDRNFKLVTCNDSFAQRLLGVVEPPETGIDVEEVLRRAVAEGHFVDAIGCEETWVEESVEALKSGPIHDITKYSDGRIFRAESVTGETGDTLVIATDITELEEQKEKLRAYAAELEAMNNDMAIQARIDELTGCGNRRMLSETLEKAREWRRKSGGELAALHIDLDRFKHINDTMGHASGDAVLAEVARRLRSECEPSDAIARMGGDEFVILLRVDPGSKRPRELVERLLAVLSRPVHFSDRVIRIGASIGIAETPLSSVDDLITNADIALYQAKGAGRGRARRYDERHLTEMTESKALADDLLRGLENDELVPFFQPQVSAETGEIVMMEVLVRWEHPQRGLLTPDSFLPIAGQLSVLNDIDNIMFEKAIAAMEQVSDNAAPIGVALNISDERLMGDEILSAAKVASAQRFPVAFELLETIYFEEDTDEFIYRIDALREQKVSIEVDDFGSGRASIVALDRIAPDRLKIDKRLVAPIAESRKSREMVRSIVEIGNALGIGITAEGVETQIHADILKDLGCQRLQGFHFARPMRLADLCDKFGLSLRKAS